MKIARYLANLVSAFMMCLDMAVEVACVHLMRWIAHLQQASGNASHSLQVAVAVSACVLHLNGCTSTCCWRLSHCSKHLARPPSLRDVSHLGCTS
jgi:hypothetical protein